MLIVGIIMPTNVIMINFIVNSNRNTILFAFRSRPVHVHW